MLNLNLPKLPTTITAGQKEILMVTNADLREPANVTCWPVQKKFEDKLAAKIRSARLQNEACS